MTRRPATPTDQGLARQFHHQAYREVVERQFGIWDDAQQDAYFDDAWPRHAHEILECDDHPCGYIAVDIGPERLDIHELVLHPDVQNKGIGTRVLDEMISQARELGVPVCLQVLRENVGARKLYERLGFQEHDLTPTHRLMRLEG